MQEESAPDPTESFEGGYGTESTWPRSAPAPRERNEPSSTAECRMRGV